MELNYLLIIFVIVMLFCIIRGARKGMLRIIFGLCAWILLICFVNYGTAIAASYIEASTSVPTFIEERLDIHLHERYTKAEEKEAGTGENAVMVLVPERLKATIEESIQESIDIAINIIAEELTKAAIKGISTILCVILGIIIIFILDKIIKAIGFVPGVKDVNRLLGIIAGFLEGMLIIWLVMFIADCFPASVMGRFVIDNSENDQILYFIYQNNIIERIIGI